MKQSEIMALQNAGSRSPALRGGRQGRAKKLAPHVAFQTILSSVMYSQQIAPKGAPGKPLPDCVPGPFII